MGLRERKKEQTRRLLADTARRLFSEHGFDRVTVAEIARAAEVSEATVFNYFPVKEDLFFSGLEVFADGLLQAVADRPTGEPLIGAVQAYVLRSAGLLERAGHGDTESLARLRTVQRVIADSAALQVREQRSFTEIAASLARLIADESAGTEADHVAAEAVAAALLGVHRALVDLVRRRVLADDRLVSLATDVRTFGEHAFARLAEGLHNYAPKPAEHA